MGLTYGSLSQWLPTKTQGVPTTMKVAGRHLTVPSYRPDNR